MKINRNLFLVGLALTTIIFFNSCQDDILNKKPLDIISDDVVWKDKTLMDAYLVNIYRATPVLVQDCSGLANGWGTDALSETGSWDREFWNSPYGAGFLLVNELGDEAKGAWDVAGSEGWKINGIGINGGLLEYWNAPYKVIRALNMFIENAQNAPVEEEYKTKRISEARFLRAFNYFAMVKRYGGVPLMNKVLQLDAPEEDLYPKRNTEKEVYDFIISEMEEVSKSFPDSYEIGRAGKWSALSLLCRASLYAGSIAQYGEVQLDGLLGIESNQANSYYKKAYDAAMVIKNSGKFSLFNKYENKTENFYKLFIEKNHSEAIFVVQHDGLDAVQSTGNGWSWDFVQCPRPHSWNVGNADAPYLEMVDEFENIDGTSGKMDRTSIQNGEWTLEELWGKKDPRFAATIWTEGTPWKGIIVSFCPGGSQNIIANDLAGKTGFGVLKYTDEEANNMEWFCRSKTDYMTFRYGEILLNLAEAAFELGQSGDALAAVNEIRERAGIAKLSSVTRESIRHERKVELAYEGHRYWDLRRWRIAESTLNDKNYSGVKYDHGSEAGKFKITILDNVHGSKNTRFEKKNYYFPITLGRTGQNSNLKENPGYE